MHPFNETQPAEVKEPIIEDENGNELRQVGVEGRERDRADGTDGECKFAGICRL